MPYVYIQTHTHVYQFVYTHNKSRTFRRCGRTVASIAGDIWGLITLHITPLLTSLRTRCMNLPVLETHLLKSQPESQD